MKFRFTASPCRALVVVGVSLALVGGLSGRPPRHIVDDVAYHKIATDGAARIHREGRLVALSALLTQPPSKEPVTFAAPATAPVAPTELYGQLRAGTVAIGVFYLCHECSNWHLDLATGFAVAEGGIVSTSAHVFAYDEDEMKDAFGVAVDAEGRVFPVEAMLAKDEESDTCLVRIAGAKLRVLPVRVGAVPGERVFCLSHPDGHYFMFSQGIVARVSRSSTMQPNEDAMEQPKTRPTLTLEVTSEYSPGSSGGPIADENGNVVAQVNLIATDTDTDHGTSGIVTARTATAAEEILRLGDPANRPALKLAPKITPAEALANLKIAVDVLESSEDDDAYDLIYAKVARAVKRGYPLMTEPAQRREFALLAAAALSDDSGNKELKKVIPMLEEIAGDKNASPEEKIQASHLLVAFAAEEVDDAAKFAVWEKRYLSHASTFPDDGEISLLKIMLLDLTEQYARERFEALAKKLSTDPDEAVAGRAKESLAEMNTRGEKRGKKIEKLPAQ